MNIQYRINFTCDVINRVEANSKSSDFVWVIDLATSSCLLNSFPVVISKHCIVVGIKSRAYAKKNEIRVLSDCWEFSA